MLICFGFAQYSTLKCSQLVLKAPGSPESFIPGGPLNFMKHVHVPTGREKVPGPTISHLQYPAKAGYSHW